MAHTVVEQASEHIAETVQQASRATGAIADAFHDGLGVARRAVKHSGDAAEEFLDDTTKRLERHVVLTAAIALAVGLTAGAVFGWAIKRG
jgi:hypothetical protein